VPNRPSRAGRRRGNEQAGKERGFFTHGQCKKGVNQRGLCCRKGQRLRLKKGNEAKNKTELAVPQGRTQRKMSKEFFCVVRGRGVKGCFLAARETERRSLVFDKKSEKDELMGVGGVGGGTTAGGICGRPKSKNSAREDRTGSACNPEKKGNNCA